jgi:hypothetical protein
LEPRIIPSVGLPDHRPGQVQSATP